MFDKITEEKKVSIKEEIQNSIFSSNIYRYINNILYEFKVLKKVITTETFNYSSYFQIYFLIYFHIYIYIYIYIYMFDLIIKIHFVYMILLRSFKVSW